MIITTERLHYLWAVAETGSFAAAGRRLGVSGAAVQQVIRHFEQDLDAPLFRRSPGRSPVLTDLGRQFYFQALDIIPRLEGLENLAATRGQGQEGAAAHRPARLRHVPGGAGRAGGTATGLPAAGDIPV